MIKFLYTTDIHGHIVKYNKVFQFAKRNNIKYVNIGADLLPNYKLEQKSFIKRFLNVYNSKCNKHGIELSAQFGNDDQHFLQKEYKGILLNNYSSPYNIEHHKFYGYSYVPDYPFCNKDFCKLDYKGWKRPPKEEYDFGYDAKLKKGLIDELDFIFEMSIKYKAATSYYNPFYFNDTGDKIYIKDLDDYFDKKTTIMDDFVSFNCEENSIISSHCPPCNLGLDVVKRKGKDGKHLCVGSKSLYEWIEKNQPMIVLCGHIHESFDITGKWKENIGNTIVVQPGQTSKKFDNVIIVYIEIENNKVITASRMEI